MGELVDWLIGDWGLGIGRCALIHESTNQPINQSTILLISTVHQPGQVVYGLCNDGHRYRPGIDAIFSSPSSRCLTPCALAAKRGRARPGIQAFQTIPQGTACSTPGAGSAATANWPWLQLAMQRPHRTTARDGVIPQLGSIRPRDLAWQPIPSQFVSGRFRFFSRCFMKLKTKTA